MAAEGHLEYAIDLYIDGLRDDPGNIEAHQALREVSLLRKSRGGADLATIVKMKLRRPGADPVEDMLNTEKLLAYDPGNRDWIAAAINHAERAGLAATKQWFFTVLGAVT
ncbi:MAG: hypothetical protein QOF78_1482 [Phycisphaerales bacterium]|nr:hypothetical protein [Phycisphaerales bacterium]